MGNFKIEIEAVGGHGFAREVKEGEPIPFDTTATDPDNIAKRLVDTLRKDSNVLSAKLVESRWLGHVLLLLSNSQRRRM
jgi:hypothetical protein